MLVWSFFSQSDGSFSSKTCGGDEIEAVAMAPDGHLPIAGAFDRLSQRVDLATGEVIDWQPDAPADDELRTWAWDEATRRWVAMPTLAALRALPPEKLLEVFATANDPALGWVERTVPMLKELGHQ